MYIFKADYCINSNENNALLIKIKILITVSKKCNA